MISNGVVNVNSVIQHSAFSTLRIFNTPHFQHFALSTLRIFNTSHCQHSAFSTRRIFNTPHFQHSAFQHSGTPYSGTPALSHFHANLSHFHANLFLPCGCLKMINVNHYEPFPCPVVLLF